MSEILLILDLFWRFFVIGLTTFGGGYAMIAQMESFLVNTGYISLEMFVDFIGISESTPGPFAVNMATFIGNHAMMALNGNEFLAVISGITSTFAVVLPSFIIILMIAVFGAKILNSRGVRYAFSGLRPVVLGLLAAVGMGLIFNALFPDYKVFDFSGFDYKALMIIFVIVIYYFFAKKGKHPIRIILLSAFLGIVLYGWFGFL